VIALPPAFGGTVSNTGVVCCHTYVVY